MRRTRAYRRHQRQRVIANRVRFLREQDPWISPGGEFAVEPGEWAKRHPRDCGGTCMMCHWEKHFDPRRAREKRQWRRDLDY